MITEEDKKAYEKYSHRGNFNRAFYSLGKWLFVKPLRHLFINLQTNLEETSEKTREAIRGSCIFVPYHCIAVEEPLIGEVIDDISAKPHALLVAKLFSKHRFIYSSLEEVPFNTEVDSSFKNDYQWSLEKLGEFLKKKESLIIFSDGETETHEKIMAGNDQSGVLPLEERPNSIIPAKLAFDYDIPIVPLAPYTPKHYEEVFYSWRNYKSWFKLIEYLRIPYRLEFLELLHPKDFKSAGDMKRAVREKQIEAYKRQRA